MLGIAGPLDTVTAFYPTDTGKTAWNIGDFLVVI